MVVGMNNTFVVEAVRASLGEVYLVGGAVRDSLMAQETKVKDYDFATPLLAEEVRHRLEQDGYKIITYSEKYGTVSAKVAQTPIQVATFRKDIYDSTSTEPKIDFQPSLLEDLRRRDFTINAIAHDGEKYIDPFEGQSDIINEKIRAVGSASLRFEEDPLRMLRALRFVSELGFTLAPDVYDAISASGRLIEELSRERITSEFNKIITGEYWIRAVSLCVETGLLENLLNVDFNEPAKDYFLENINSQEASLSTLGNRWQVFVIALVHALQQGGRIRSSRKTLYDVFEKIRLVMKWPSSFEQSLLDKLVADLAEEDLQSLESDYTELKKEKDNRQFIVLSKIYNIKIRQAVNERRLNEASNLAKKLIDVQNKNLQLRLKRGDERSEVIKDYLPSMLDSVRYIYLREIEKADFFDTKHALNELIGNMLRLKNTFDLFVIDIGRESRLTVIEEAILITNRIFVNRITSFSDAEVMDGNKWIKRSNNRVHKIKNAYLRELIALRRPPYLEDVVEKRKTLNHRIAKLLLEMNGNVPTLDYYSHLVDHYKWKALMSKNIKVFWDTFEYMNNTLDIIEKDPKFRMLYNFDSQYLYNAQCLTFAVTLESDIEEKISLVRNIVANYKLVKHRSRKNASRYTLLLEWLFTCKELINGNVSISKEILNKLPYLKSYHYRDSDEEYVSVQMPEIDKVRTHFYDLEAFLAALNGVKLQNIEILNPTLRSIISLRQSSFIDPELAYEIFKNFLRSLLDASAPLEPISLLRDAGDAKPEPLSENMELIKGGETETVEFKQSWRYDVQQKQIDPSGVVLESAIKAIASFMNTNGGLLFLGVHDSGEIIGLEDSDFLQFKRKALNQLGLQDSLKKVIDDQLRRSLGAAVATLIKVSFEIFDGKTICVVSVLPSSQDVFFGDKYFIRASASCRELSIKEYSEYRLLKPSRVDGLLKDE